MASWLRAWLILFVVGVVAISGAARADGGAIPLRVRVTRSDAPTCVDDAGFFAAVYDAEPKIERVEASEAPLADVTFRARGTEGFAGELRFESSGRNVLSRVVEGGDCADVRRALALVVALQAVEVAAAKAAPPPVVRKVSPFPIHSLWLGGGVRALFNGQAVAPAVSLGWALEAGTERWPFAFRVGVALAQNAYSMDTRVLTALLDACPYAFGTRRTVMFAPCVRGELGTRRYIYPDLNLWSAVGPSVNLAVHIGGGFGVAFDAALLKTLYHPGPTTVERGTALGTFAYPSFPRAEMSGSLAITWSFFSDLRPSR